MQHLFLSESYGSRVGEYQLIGILFDFDTVIKEIVGIHKAVGKNFSNGNMCGSIVYTVYSVKLERLFQIHCNLQVDLVVEIIYIPGPVTTVRG